MLKFKRSVITTTTREQDQKYHFYIDFTSHHVIITWLFSLFLLSVFTFNKLTLTHYPDFLLSNITQKVESLRFGLTWFKYSGCIFGYERVQSQEWTFGYPIDFGWGQFRFEFFWENKFRLIQIL